MTPQQKREAFRLGYNLRHTTETPTEEELKAYIELQEVLGGIVNEGTTDNN